MSSLPVVFPESYQILFVIKIDPNPCLVFIGLDIRKDLSKFFRDKLLLLEAKSLMYPRLNGLHHLFVVGRVFAIDK